jgi:hypothetical protein
VVGLVSTPFVVPIAGIDLMISFVVASNLMDKRIGYTIALIVVIVAVLHWVELSTTKQENSYYGAVLI